MNTLIIVSAIVWLGGLLCSLHGREEQAKQLSALSMVGVVFSLILIVLSAYLKIKS